MTLSPVIPFGEWIPDKAPFMNEGVIVATNVLPDGKEYKPFKTLVGNTDTLPSECKGAVSFVTEAGTVETFAGTNTKLYRLSGNTWVDITRVSGDYNVAVDQYWTIINYGNRVIATNYTDAQQSFVIGSSTNFIDMPQSGGGIPRSKYMTVLNNFIMNQNVVHPDDNVRGARLQWSGLDDPTYYADSTTDPTTNAAKQAGFQDVYGDYGLGTGIVPLKDYGVAYFERGIVRVSFVGAPLTFKIEGVESKTGSRVPRSIVSSGQAVFSLAEDGFYMFDGASNIPIGDQRIDRFFYSDVNPNAMFKVQGTVDPKNKIVGWLYQSNDAENDMPDRLIIYSWAHNRWALANVAAQVMLEGLTASKTLEDVGALYPNLELVPYSLDSRIWAGGNNLLSAVTYDGKVGVFEGVNAEAVIETTEVQFNPDGYALMSGVLPVVDTPDCLVSIGSRKLISAPVVYTGNTDTNDETGEADVFVENRFLRARVTIEEGTEWTKAQGVRFRAEKGGNL